jgi:hypothetical protein
MTLKLTEKAHEQMGKALALPENERRFGKHPVA